MTRTQLRTITDAITAAQGRGFVTSSAEINRVINERLADFTELTRCLYDDYVAFTVSTSTSLYDIRGSAFAKDLIIVDQIGFNGSLLNDFFGDPGPVPFKQFVREYPGYVLEATPGPAQHWTRLEPHHIRLSAKPDQVYSNCWAAGPVLHPAIDTSSGGDSTEISIPSEHQQAAAYWCAIGLLGPTANGLSELDRLRQLNPTVADAMSRLMSRGDTMATVGSVRGEHNDRPVRPLS